MLHNTLWILLLISFTTPISAKEHTASNDSQQSATEHQAPSSSNKRLRPRKRTQWAEGLSDVGFVDIAKALKHCYSASDTVHLWRANSQSATWLSIQADTATLRLPWPEGEHLVAWPANITLQDGASYMLSVDNWLETVITFHVIPDHLATDAQRIKWMQSQQCHVQADMFTQSPPKP